MDFYHDPVLLEETLQLLQPRPGGVYVDATLGGGGHFEEIIARAKGEGIFIGIDQDEDAIERAKMRFADASVRLIRENFRSLGDIIRSEGLEKIDGIIFDLGISSHQVDEADRGFSYMKDAPLDMRMDKRVKSGAWEAVNRLPEKDLKQIIKDYGEESWAGRIAEFICERRKHKSIDSTGELAEIVKEAIPAKFRRRGPHPAKRTFQAIRIYVNDELSTLQTGIIDAVEMLRPGGRICIITFHSLEDRIVKNLFKEMSADCLCPKGSIVCNCNHRKKVELLTTKPIFPGEKEIEENPRSRSAKLRAAQRI